MKTSLSMPRAANCTALVLCVLLLANCGRGVGFGAPTGPDEDKEAWRGESGAREQTLFEALRASGKQESTVLVNKYIWSATLQVLDFLPVQTVDPFTGVIVTGFGNPPGGGNAYRATVLINDPALDARSLNVALQTRSGPASASAVRAVEDAILTRARQLRIADNRL